MEVETEQAKASADQEPTPEAEAEAEVVVATKQRGSPGGSGSGSVSTTKRNGSSRKGGSLRRDQLTGEKRRSRTGSLGSLVGYEARYPPLQFIENLATQPDYVFKILVVGNSYVGKSSFLMRLCTNAFSARYSSTIGELIAPVYGTIWYICTYVMNVAPNVWSSCQSAVFRLCGGMGVRTIPSIGSRIGSQ
jgi:hypothetical protein